MVIGERQMSAETLSILAGFGVQIVLAGIFIGTLKTQISNVIIHLRRIEDKQDKQNDEISELRERVAVIESHLDIRKHK